MDPLSAVIGVGGSLLSGFIGSSGASAQRAWEERMLNTQYQRTSKDMIAAGLNPMMMYMKGGGPTGGVPTPPNIQGPMSESVATAARQAAIDIPMAKSQMAKNAADASQSLTASAANTDYAAKARADADVARGQLAVQLQQLEQMKHQIDLTDQQRATLQQEIDEIKAKALLERRSAALAAVNARKGTVEANALDLLNPFISTAKAALEEFNKSREKYPREDIRPQSYIQRTKGTAAAGPAQTIAPSGVNSAKSGWQQLKEAATADWKYLINP